MASFRRRAGRAGVTGSLQGSGVTSLGSARGQGRGLVADCPRTQHQGMRRDNMSRHETDPQLPVHLDKRSCLPISHHGLKGPIAA